MKSVCVFCGSSAGRRPAYRAAARLLGAEIAGRGMTLIYGGASIGLMGAVADAAIEAGGAVVGVIPRALVDLEIAHDGLAALHVVDSMHARKQMMADLSDGFVAMPGGAGTLEEVFEVWTWAQLGHHEKPVGLYNAEGYYDRLTSFFDFQATEGFVRDAHREMVIVDADPVRLLDRFAGYRAPHIAKWIADEER